ncbi:unnamed protein product [Caenorhabditis bovis]|uniref:Uncharacterized protein n=1 Tax=Caenorhabditis bovis TaxID=2654633 RepID=A0A8S1EHL6_9PELO|nr:unnamed protein product [Caenorhabditis bovis]
MGDGPTSQSPGKPPPTPAELARIFLQNQTIPPMPPPHFWRMVQDGRMGMSQVTRPAPSGPYAIPPGRPQFPSGVGPAFHPTAPLPPAYYYQATSNSNIIMPGPMQPLSPHPNNGPPPMPPRPSQTPFPMPPRPSQTPQFHRPLTPARNPPAQRQVTTQRPPPTPVHALPPSRNYPISHSQPVPIKKVQQSVKSASQRHAHQQSPKEQKSRHSSNKEEVAKQPSSRNLDTSAIRPRKASTPFAISSMPLNETTTDDNQRISRMESPPREVKPVKVPRISDPVNIKRHNDLLRELELGRRPFTDCDAFIVVLLIAFKQSHCGSK